MTDGGKARGVAFANRILRSSGVDEAFPSVDVYVPPSIVVGKQIYDALSAAGLQERDVLGVSR